MFQRKPRHEPNHRTTADLVVEVISPESAIYDRNTKADTYAALGVKELWLIDEVNESVEIRTLEGERYPVGIVFENGDQIRSAVLPALAFDVRRIFAD